jgi:uncharacterized protein involved in response to NO
MICSVVYRFRAIPFSPQSRLEIAGFADSDWYRFGGAGHAALAWIAAFGLFAWVYTPILTTPGVHTKVGIRPPN